MQAHKGVYKMQSMRTNLSSGFTLIEVIVVAPIIILFIGAFVGLLVTLTGNSLLLRETNASAFDVQNAIDDMQTTASGATSFLATTGTVQSPQGKNLSTGAFTNTDTGKPDTLIIKSPATTRNPVDSTAEAVYSGTGSCNKQNPVYTYMTVYTVINNSLYKRTIVPQAAACQTPWQRNSCPLGWESTSTVCQTADEKLIDNVASIDIKYYPDPYSTVQLDDSLAESASAISINITLTKSVAGEPLTYSGSARVASINTKKVPTTVMDPSISVGVNATDPYSTDFTWDAVGNASSYRIRSRPNSSASWTTTTVNVTNPSQTQYTHTVATLARKQTAEIEVTVNTTNGSYLYGTASRTMSRWNTCAYQGTWAWYGSPYLTAGYTKTSDHIVGLRGLVRNGTIGTTICTLPPAFRPAQKEIFQVAGYQGGVSGSARVDVNPDGTVVAVDGETNWVSLDGIVFKAASATSTWTAGTWLNSWTNYGSGHGDLKYTKDSLGRVTVEGLGRAGTVASGTLMTNMLTPAATRPSHFMHMPSRGGGVTSSLSLYTTGAINKRSTGTGWQAFNFTYYPATFNAWTAIPFAGSWANYDAVNYSPAQCAKGADDLVIIRGLIKTGSGVISNALPTACGSYADGRLLLHGIHSPDNAARIDIYPSGSNTVVEGNVTSTAWTSIDNLRFIAD